MQFDVIHIKIEIYTPPQYVIPLRDGLNELGACHVGNYDHVLSFHECNGCWRPLEGSNPFWGEVGAICCAQEVKMELICPAELAAQAVERIKQIHPYEEPVINLIPMLSLPNSHQH